MVVMQFEHLRLPKRNIVWRQGGRQLTREVFTPRNGRCAQVFVYLILTECKEYLNDQFLKSISGILSMLIGDAFGKTQVSVNLPWAR